MEQMDNIQDLRVAYVKGSHFMDTLEAEATHTDLMKIMNPSIIKFAGYVTGQFSLPRADGYQCVVKYAMSVGLHVKGTFIDSVVPGYSNQFVNESLREFSTYLFRVLPINHELSHQLLDQYVYGEGAKEPGTFMDKHTLTPDGRVMYKSTSGEEKYVKMEESISPQRDIQMSGGDPSLSRLNLLADVCHHVSLQQGKISPQKGRVALQQGHHNIQSFWESQELYPRAYEPFVLFERSANYRTIPEEADVYQATPRRQLDYQNVLVSKQQPVSASMDWSVDQPISVQCNDNHQHLKSEETQSPAPSSVRRAFKKITNKGGPVVDFAKPTQMPDPHTSLYKLAEAFGKVDGIGMHKAQDILNCFLKKDQTNVPSTLMSTDQIAPQAANDISDPDSPKMLAEMQKLDIHTDSRDVDMDNDDVQMGGPEEGQGEDAESSATQQVDVQQRFTPAGPATKFAMRDTPALDSSSESDEEAPAQFTAKAASAKKAAAKNTPAKKSATNKALTGTPGDAQQATPTVVKTRPAKSYKDTAGNIHFDVLLTKNVITEGDYILVTSPTDPDVTARMEFVSYMGRTSSWKVYCEDPDIDGDALVGTGPLQWGVGLRNMGFEPPKNFGAARVFQKGKYIGNVNALKQRWG